MKIATGGAGSARTAATISATVCGHPGVDSSATCSARSARNSRSTVESPLAMTSSFAFVGYDLDARCWVVRNSWGVESANLQSHIIIRRATYVYAVDVRANFKLGPAEACSGAGGDSAVPFEELDGTNGPGAIDVAHAHVDLADGLRKAQRPTSPRSYRSARARRGGRSRRSWRSSSG